MKPFLLIDSLDFTPYINTSITDIYDTVIKFDYLPADLEQDLGIRVWKGLKHSSRFAQEFFFPRPTLICSSHIPSNIIGAFLDPHANIFHISTDNGMNFAFVKLRGDAFIFTPPSQILKSVRNGALL